MHDLLNSLGIAQIIAPQTVQAAPVASDAIDLQGCESLALIVAVGNIVDTLDSENRIDVKIEHADDNGNGAPAAFTACADSDVMAAPEALNAGVFLSIDDAGLESKRHTIGYCGGKRFVKVTATPVSMTTGGPMAVLAIKGNLAQRPAAN